MIWSRRKKEILNQNRMKKQEFVLAGVTQWIECQPANQEVTGLIPNQSTCLGCRPGSQEGVRER